MPSWFRSSRLEPAKYLDSVSDDLSPDPDDRIHVAPCRDGRANVLLTRNTKDFPVETRRDERLDGRKPA